MTGNGPDEPATAADENDKLRGLLAWGSDPCIYCGLARHALAKCVRGFPGCARADDMLSAPSLENWTRPPTGTAPPK